MRFDGVGKAFSDSHDELGDDEHDENLDSSSSIIVMIMLSLLDADAEYSGCEYSDCLAADLIES